MAQSMSDAAAMDDRASKGQVQLVVGPMFSGKSTELLRRMRKHQHARRRCVLIKHASDNRYSSAAKPSDVCTHDLQTRDAVPVERLVDAVFHCSEADVIGIDEAQFFDDLVTFVDSMAERGKIVIVAGLDSTFARDPFVNVCMLLSRAETVDKLTAVCNMCGNDAHFSKRLTADTDVHLIGGASTYAPRCRQCF